MNISFKSLCLGLELPTLTLTLGPLMLSMVFAILNVALFAVVMHFLEGYPIDDAFYFAMITLTSIGDNIFA